MYNRHKLIRYIFLALLLIGCTTKKNTVVTRSYHNLTSRFNVLFNGKESYNAGVKKIHDNFDFDYDELLPVFLYVDKDLNLSASSDMERTLKKTSKLIALHSITVKPELKSNKPLTADEKEFYDQKEFNKWVDNNYLLMGKAHFYNNSYNLAKETFRFILRDFNDPDILIETQIWLARTYIENKEFRDADLILSELVFNPNISKKLKDDLYTTLADYQLRIKNYEKGREYLLQALEYSHHKKNKIRYTFLLAQLSAELGEYQKAYDLYDEVIKMNPPYEMTFNARINKALVYETNLGRAGGIKDELLKMLKDDKNIEFLDQIYFALGEIEMKEGNKKQAIEYYELSVKSSVDNTDQKAKSFLTLAELFYIDRLYLNSQAYYDSVINIIDNSYKNYDVIYSKANSLSKLAEYVNTFNLQDSVQKLADLPRDEIMQIIDNIITDVIKEEEEQKRLEQQRLEDMQFEQQQALQNSLRLDNNSGGSWYFYNPTTLSSGKGDFAAKWGNRKLEDNWRRKNKSSSSFDELDEEEALAEEEDGKSEMSNKSPEYYLVDIPFSDSMLTASHEKIKKALFNMAMVYRTDLQDYDNAIESFEELLRRYPKSDYELPTYYNLYDLYRELGNNLMQDAYKNKILAEYPNSRFALVISDPDYARKLEQEENRVENLYKQAFDLFKQKNYNLALQKCKQGITNYPDHKNVVNFKYLSGIIYGYLNQQPQLEAELKRLIADYPDHELASQAKEILDSFGKEIQITEEEVVEVKEAEVEFLEVNDREPHLCLMVVEKGVNINQLVFNIINFNLDNYTRQNLNAEYKPFTDKFELVEITRFRSKREAINYVNNLQSTYAVYRDVDQQKIKGVAISVKNYQLLLSSKSINSYLQFHSQNY